MTRKLLPLLALAMLLTPLPASAKITTPANGATVRGDVFINEDTGGTEEAICALFGARANSTITVTRLADNTSVFSASKGSAGAWSTVWPSQAQPNGQYRIKSVAKDRKLSSFCGASNKTLSDIVVTLENFLAFVDDDGAGTVFVNPYTKQFRVVTPGYNSGVRSDPSMSVADVPNPAAPCDPTACAPTLRPACQDPTSPAFLAYILVEGPQGCVQGGPGLPPTPSVPPSVPAIPEDPTATPLPSQCSLPGTAGCGSTMITIAYDDADLALSGVFETGSRVFAAGLTTKADNNATAFRHSPSA